MVQYPMITANLHTVQYTTIKLTLGEDSNNIEFEFQKIQDFPVIEVILFYFKTNRRMQLDIRQNY